MTLADVVQATWPPARNYDLGPFTLRDGAGGGKRVSAASVNAAFSPADISAAEAAMRGFGQTPLFVIWPDSPHNQRLDAALAQRDYGIVDPVIGYTAPISALRVQDVPLNDTYPNWPPLAICTDLWAQMGVGPARLAVMVRAAWPKTVILQRNGDHPAGLCFVAIAGNTAMIHALEVLPAHRRQGSAQKIIARAAQWAGQNGAAKLGLVVTRANTPARALYAKLGMVEDGAYHYRQLELE